MAIVEAAAHDERSVGSSEPTKRIGDNFRELDDVALAVSTFVPAIGRELLSGTRGTVVEVWRGGEAYEVEFFAPFDCLVTVGLLDLAA
jgi:hypothetical protein